jgi:hypothetical protein
MIGKGGGGGGGSEVDANGEKRNESYKNDDII